MDEGAGRREWDSPVAVQEPVPVVGRPVGVELRTTVVHRQEWRSQAMGRPVGVELRTTVVSR